MENLARLRGTSWEIRLSRVSSRDRLARTPCSLGTLLPFKGGQPCLPTSTTSIPCHTNLALDIHNQIISWILIAASVTTTTASTVRRQYLARSTSRQPRLAPILQQPQPLLPAPSSWTIPQYILSSAWTLFYQHSRVYNTIVPQFDQDHLNLLHQDHIDETPFSGFPIFNMARHGTELFFIKKMGYRYHTHHHPRRRRGADLFSAF